jgi:diguanylate cyclase (GGDEF)-like protein
MDPNRLSKRLHNIFWQLTLGGIFVYFPVFIFNGSAWKPNLWAKSGFTQELAFLAWIGGCWLISKRWPLGMAVICLLGLIPLTGWAISGSAQADTVRALELTPLTRMVVTTPIVFVLGLFVGWPGAVLGTLLATLSLGQQGNLMQIVVGANVLLTLGLLGTFTRSLIGRLEQAYQKLEQASFSDALTGLNNRRALDTIYASQSFMWLTLWDLDGLKKLNDTQGHLAGNAYLLEFTQALCKNLTPRDYAFRVGGDEFIVLHAGQIQTTELIQTVRSSFAHVSCGAVRLEGLNMDQAIFEADDAMYQDKRERKQHLDSS